MNDYLLVSGYLGTGSSAVVDFLKEFDGFVECDAEIRMIKDPSGLYELFTSVCDDNWDSIRSSNSVWNFLETSKKWARYGKSPLSPAGQSYKNRLTKSYMKYSRRFIEEICDGIFKVDSYSDGFRKNYFKFVLDRNLRYVEKITKGKLRVGNRGGRKNYLCHPTKERFLVAARRFLDSVFGDFLLNHNGRVLILDQAIPANNPEMLDLFFPGHKMIIVDRDPRDAFVDNQIGVDFLEKHPNTVEFAKTWCSFYRFSHGKKTLRDDVLYVQFEDFVLNYEKEARRIADFIGFQPLHHSSPLKFFNPAVSAGNIGLYKRYSDQFGIAIDFITNELSDYLYGAKK